MFNTLIGKAKENPRLGSYLDRFSDIGAEHHATISIALARLQNVISPRRTTAAHGREYEMAKKVGRSLAFAAHVINASAITPTISLPSFASYLLF